MKPMCFSVDPVVPPQSVVVPFGPTATLLRKLGNSSSVRDAGVGMLGGSSRDDGLLRVRCHGQGSFCENGQARATRLASYSPGGVLGICFRLAAESSSSVPPGVEASDFQRKTSFSLDLDKVFPAVARRRRWLPSCGGSREFPTGDLFSERLLRLGCPGWRVGGTAMRSQPDWPWRSRLLCGGGASCFRVLPCTPEQRATFSFARFHLIGGELLRGSRFPSASTFTWRLGMGPQGA